MYMYFFSKLNNEYRVNKSSKFKAVHVFVLAVPRYPLDLVNLFIAVSLQVKTH